MFRLCEKDFRSGLIVGLGGMLFAAAVARAIVPVESVVSTGSNYPPVVAEPGWVAPVAEMVSPEDALQILGVEPVGSDVSVPHGSTQGAYATSGDYEALADALDNDPLRIYQYVRNNFEYVPYFGYLKGPYLTLHERSGNDYDQAALLVELLRAADIPARFQFGAYDANSPVDIQAVADLLGTDADIDIIGRTFSQGGVPATQTSSSIRFNRVWVEATIDQQDVALDPAFKRSTRYDAIDLAAAMNYSEAELLAAAGGTETSSSVSGIGLDALADYLRDRATNLQDYLKANHPNDRVEKVLGGFQIVQDNTGSLPKSLPMSMTGVPESRDEIPPQYIHKVRLRHGGIDLTKSIPDIAGRKISLTYKDQTNDVLPPVSGATDYGSIGIGMEGVTNIWQDTNSEELSIKVVAKIQGANFSSFAFTQGGGSQIVAPEASYSVGVKFVGSGQIAGRKSAQLAISLTRDGKTLKQYTFDLTGIVEPHPLAELYIDDQLVASESRAIGDLDTLQLIISHPYAANSGSLADQTRDFDVKRSGSYVIVSAFGGDNDSTLLGERQRILNRMSVDGTAPNANKRLTETLNIIGQTWMQQTQLNSDLLFNLSGKRRFVHHRFGIAGQEEGYFVDMAAQMITIADRSESPEQGAFKAQAFVASAMEHSVLDQLQGVSNSEGLTNPAASTIRLMALTNWIGKRLFVANKLNWDSILPHLRNYSADQLVEFKLKTDASHTLVIPEDGKVPLKEWTGLGYVDFWNEGDELSIGMIIGGGLNGGKSTLPAKASTRFVRRDYLPEIVPRKEVPVTTALDPVDLATGAFISSKTDFGVAGSGTRGFAFTRSYNSQLASRDTAGLGRGWTHNYNIYLSKHSDVEAALGERTVFDAVPMLIVNHVARDLLQQKNPTPKQWGVAAMVANWGMDQLLNKSITVNMGSQALTYQEMPNGDYVPPPGVTTNLLRTGTTYKLQERFGTTWAFNSDDSISTIKDVDGEEMIFSYNGAGKVTQVQDAHSRRLFFQYANDQLVRTYDSTFHTVSYTQTNGNLTKVHGLENANWTYGYDSLHRLETVKNPDNVQIVDNTYNDFDRVVEQNAPRDTGLETYKLHYGGFMSAEEDPEGNRITYHFDSDGRRVAIEDALGNTSRIVYDGQGQVVAQTDPRGSSSYFVYDSDNNLKEQINDSGKKVKFFYDDKHRKVEARDALNHKVSFAYDARHRLTEHENHYGNKVWTTYLSDGLVDTVTDPRGTQANNNYDANGYLESSQIASHPPVMWNYNNRGDLMSQVDQAGAKTSFTYDSRGLVKTRTDSLGKSTTRNYTNSGRLAQSTDRKDRVSYFTYTDSGKPDMVYYLDSVVDFNYDARDNLREMIDSTGATTNTHDIAGRLTSQTNSNGHTVGYQYDAAGNITALTYPPGSRQVKYTYDNLNRLSTVTIDWLPGKPTMQYLYDDANRVSRVEHFNEMSTDYTWDNADRLTGIAHQGGDSLVAYSFLLDANGNRQQETILPEPFMPGSLILQDTSFTYNLNRNRLNSTSKHDYTYGSEGQLTGTVGSVDNRYSYDHEGQLVDKDDVNYTFDDAHRLIQRGGDTFVYDGVGNRVKAIRDGLETQYVYDAGGNLLAEANSAGQVLRYYIYGAGLTATVKGNTYYVYHHDGTGHTVALTNASNEVVNRYAYSPYGELLGQQESFTQPFKYAGQMGIFTESENLYYMRARYYDAEVGRFISEDPAGFVDGPNLYAYVGGNPIMSVDPTGLITWSGTATTLSASGPVGASLTRYKLTSEMVGGKEASVVVTAVGPSIGYGANIGGTHSQIAFEDSRSQIDTSVFNGRYRAIQIGSTIPFGPGYGAYAIEMGDATSVDHGRIDIGYDSSITGTIGSSTVTSTTWISGK